MAHQPSLQDHVDTRRRRSLLDSADVTSAKTAENGDVLLTIRMSEKLEDDVEEFDTSGFEFGPQALNKLKVQDPFLYYSIQNDLKRRSSYASEADAGGGDTHVSDAFDLVSNDTSNFRTSSSNTSILMRSAARRTSMPSLNIDIPSPPRQARRHSTIATANTVKRWRRLSTEAHPSLMYEEMFQGLDLDVSDETRLDDVDEEDLLSFLKDAD